MQSERSDAARSSRSKTSERESAHWFAHIYVVSRPRVGSGEVELQTPNGASGPIQTLVARGLALQVDVLVPLGFSVGLEVEFERRWKVNAAMLRAGFDRVAYSSRSSSSLKAYTWCRSRSGGWSYSGMRCRRGPTIRTIYWCALARDTYVSKSRSRSGWHRWVRERSRRGVT